MFEKILYPTDLSKATKNTLTYTKHLKEAGTKEVVVLNVIDQKVIDTIGLIVSAKVVQSVESEIKKLEEDRKKRLEPIIAELKECGYSVRMRIERGIPYKEILRIEEEEDVSAIVIGSHGTSNVEEMLIGSVSEKVIRWCKKPVLVIKR